ncbi:MAG: serine/threonine protein kinase, partial [Deltaproteobacteria bacterium]|nr:serine/threonine protein kinase [Deltaproteobacteria bacterium]MBW2537733.1 serine/threonine protein kinase [Deltaproteobacteria bacterium]
MGMRFGRYETLREIAAGGMATVFLGRAVGEGGFERRVAIKVMHAHLARDDEFVTMFLDEARLAAGIHHPNVVGTIDVQKLDDGMFLVMDYVEGASLQEVRKYLKKSNELLPLGIALRILLDALTGLHSAHELTDGDGNLLQVVHRDVSPQNILVGKDGVSRLTDFGVARASARLSSTRGGQLKGKLAYMPPEQIMAETVDRRSDVYSAGVVLWEALVGKRLFRAKSDGELVHKILDSAIVPPHVKNDRVPLPISDACMRALSLDRNNRYPTAAAFADDLEDAARTEDIPVASSRAVGTFMKAILPALELSRPSTDALTPPSGLSQVSRPKQVRVLGDSSPSAVATRPSQPSSLTTGGSTQAAAVVPQVPRSQISSNLAVVGAALVAGVVIGVFTLWPSAPSTESVSGGPSEPPPPPTATAAATAAPTTSEPSTAPTDSIEATAAPSAAPDAGD